MAEMYYMYFAIDVPTFWLDEPNNILNVCGPRATIL